LFPLVADDHRQERVSRLAEAAVRIAQRCNGVVVAKLAIACQSSDFRCHLNEATELATRPRVAPAG
jgi:hypothetical protein